MVRIKSMSPSFLSLIGSAEHCLSALKEAVKYLSINEPHLPTDLLTWDSLSSSRTSPPCSLSAFAPGHLAGPQQPHRWLNTPFVLPTTPGVTPGSRGNWVILPQLGSWSPQFSKCILHTGGFWLLPGKLPLHLHLVGRGTVDF